MVEAIEEDNIQVDEVEVDEKDQIIRNLEHELQHYRGELAVTQSKELYNSRLLIEYLMAERGALRGMLEAEQRRQG